MTLPNDVDVDLDSEAPGEDGSGFPADTIGCLPIMPLVGLPLLGFPLLPSFNVPIPLDFKAPGFLSAAADAIRDRLSELVGEFDLDLDVDLDLDAETLLAAARSAAGTATDVVLKLQARIAEAMGSQIAAAVGIPLLPITGLPILGFPLLPSFNLLFPVLSSLPSFMLQQARDAAREALAAQVAGMGLDLDLDGDLPVADLTGFLKRAGADLTAAQAAQLQKAVVRTFSVDPTELFTPPVMPLVGLPILGFPILPSFNLQFVLDLDCPAAKLAGWAAN